MRIHQRPSQYYSGETCVIEILLEGAQITPKMCSFALSAEVNAIDYIKLTLDKPEVQICNAVYNVEIKKEDIRKYLFTVGPNNHPEFVVIELELGQCINKRIKICISIHRYTFTMEHENITTGTKRTHGLFKSQKTPLTLKIENV